MAKRQLIIMHSLIKQKKNIVIYLTAIFFFLKHEYDIFEFFD